jgi:hypothetical protein
MRVTIVSTEFGLDSKEYDLGVTPRIGDVLDLREAGTGTPHPALEVSPLFVAHVVHRIGPEPDCHRILIRVVTSWLQMLDLQSVPDPLAQWYSRL